MVGKLTYNYLATALVDILAVSRQIVRRDIVLCDKPAHFRVASYCPQHKCTCVMIMLFNQLPDIPHLDGLS